MDDHRPFPSSSLRFSLQNCFDFPPAIIDDSFGIGETVACRTSRDDAFLLPPAPKGDEKPGKLVLYRDGDGGEEIWRRSSPLDPMATEESVLDRHPTDCSADMQNFVLPSVIIGTGDGDDGVTDDALCRCGAATIDELQTTAAVVFPYESEDSTVVADGAVSIRTVIAQDETTANGNETFGLQLIEGELDAIGAAVVPATEEEITAEEKNEVKEGEGVEEEAWMLAVPRRIILRKSSLNSLHGDRNDEHTWTDGETDKKGRGGGEGEGEKRGENLQKMRWNSLFERMDRNKDGFLTRLDFICAIRSNKEIAKELHDLLGLPYRIRQEDGSRDTFVRAFEAMDRNDTDSIDHDEFVSYLEEVALQVKEKKEEEAANTADGGEETLAKSGSSSAANEDETAALQGADASASAAPTDAPAAEARIPNVGQGESVLPTKLEEEKVHHYCGHSETRRLPTRHEARAAIDQCGGSRMPAVLSSQELGAFHAAVIRGDSGWVKRMLTTGEADRPRPIDEQLALTAHCRDASTRWLPLHHAASLGHAQVVDALLTEASGAWIWASFGTGCLVDARSVQGASPLHCAAMGGHVEAMRVLLTWGAGTEAETIQLYTPLHYAAASGSSAACRTLLEYGASMDAKEAFGRTPEAIASQQGHLFAVRTLQSQRAVIRADNAVRKAKRLKNNTKYKPVKSGAVYIYPGKQRSRKKFVGNF